VAVGVPAAGNFAQAPSKSVKTRNSIKILFIFISDQVPIVRIAAGEDIGEYLALNSQVLLAQRGNIRVYAQARLTEQAK